MSCDEKNAWARRSPRSAPIRSGTATPRVPSVDRNFAQAILSQLRGRERQALWQSAVEYRPIGEIGTYLGLSYMAAPQLLHRARRHALVVAAKLAAIVGLLQLSRLGKRPASGIEVQPLAVALVMPLVIAGLVVASSPHQASTQPIGAPGAMVVGSPAGGGAATNSSTSAVSAKEVLGRPGPTAVTPPALLRQARSAIDPLLTCGLPALTGSLPTAVPLPGLAPVPPAEPAPR